MDPFSLHQSLFLRVFSKDYVFKKEDFGLTEENFFDVKTFSSFLLFPQNSISFYNKEQHKFVSFFIEKIIDQDEWNKNGWSAETKEFIITLIYLNPVLTQCRKVQIYNILNINVQDYYPKMAKAVMENHSLFFARALRSKDIKFLIQCSDKNDLYFYY